MARNFIPLVPSGTINADASVAQLEQDVLAMDSKVGELAEDIGDTEQEINQLKSQISDLALTGTFGVDFGWEDGTISGSTGGDSPSTTDERTGKFLCADLEGLIFTKGTSNDLEVYYYDNSESFLSPYAKKTADFTFETPANAVYVRFCTKKSTNVWTAQTPSNLVLKADLVPIANAIDKVGTTTADLSQKNYVDGYYLSRQGTLVEDPNYCVSEKISVAAIASSAFFYGTDYDSALKINLCSYKADGTLVDFWGPTSGSAVRSISSFGTGAAYIRFSYVKGYSDAKLGSAPGSVDNFVYWEPNDAKAGSVASKAIGGNINTKITTAIDANTVINLCHNSLRSPKIFFYGKFSSFAAIEIGHGQTGDYSQYFKIDNTNVTFYTNGNEGSAVAHGLTMDEYIAVVIDVAYNNNYKITVNTLGGSWSREMSYPNPWQGQNGNTFVKNVSSTFTYWSLSQTGDYQFSKWMFGDSYLTNYSTARWPYYFEEYGIPYTMLNAFPGADSEDGYIDWLDALQHGTPKYAIWCLGMNDPDSGAVNATWLAVVQMFIADCNERGITPILATIPNTPTYTHTYKNAWIKNSGYRYIDVAEAVGAEEAGSTWIDGCLEEGAVRTHPTEDGARLIFMRAIQDFPEFFQA